MVRPNPLLIRAAAMSAIRRYRGAVGALGQYAMTCEDRNEQSDGCHSTCDASAKTQLQRVEVLQGMFRRLTDRVQLRRIKTKPRAGRERKRTPARVP